MPSRPVLIGRGLVTHPPQHEKLRVHYPESEPTTHPSTREHANTGTGFVHNRTTVHNVTAAIAAGKHPDPSRTRKLSQPAPMVLHPTGCGRVGRRRTSSPKRATHWVALFLFPGVRPTARPAAGERPTFRPQPWFKTPFCTGRSRPRRARRWAPERSWLRRWCA